MPIDVDRQFASVGLSAGNRALAPRPLPSGDLEATQATGGAVMRRFEAVGRAIDVETQSLIQQGDAIAGLGEGVRVSGRELTRTFTAIEQRRRQAFQRHQAATARAQFMRDADETVRTAIADSDPAGTDIEATVRERLREQKDKRLAGIDDEDFRLAVSDNLELISVKAEITARKAQAKKEGDFLRNELSKRLGAYGAQARQHRGENQAQFVAIAVDDIRDSIEDGTLAPQDGEKAIASFRAGVREFTIQSDADANPGRAASRLESGVYEHLFANDIERAAAANTIAKSTQAFLDRAKKQAAAEYQIQISDFELTGPTEETIEAAYRDGRGWLKPGDRTMLVKAARKRQKTASEATEAIALVDRVLGGGVVLDPRNKDHKKAVDTHFRHTLPKLLEGPDAPRKMANYVKRAGMVPETLKSGIRARLRGGNPEEKLQAAQFMELAASENPSIARDFEGDERRFMGMLARLASAGMAAETAVSRATEVIFQADDPVREVRKKRMASEKHADAFDGWLKDAFTRGARESIPFVDETVLPDALKAELGVVYEAHYLATGDQELSRDLSLEDLRRVWGVTTIGGRRMMKYAPATIYGFPGTDVSWIGEQFQTDMRADSVYSTSLEGRLRISVDAVSARERHPETGAFWPSYVVLLQNETTGVFEPMRQADGSLRRWRPDWSTSPAHQRQLAEQQAELERAKQLDMTARQMRGLQEERRNLLPMPKTSRQQFEERAERRRNR